MAIEIPNWLEPLLSFYGIPWPDIDEDAFEDLKQPLRIFGNDLYAVGDAIDSALRLLESGNPSHTLRAIITYFEAIRADFLSPITSVCDDLAGSPCDVAHDSIVAVKVGLITLLAGEIANDIGAVVATIATLGLDSVLTAGEAVAVREAVSEAITIAEGDVASAILSATNQCLDNFVSSLVNPFINGVSSRVENSVNSYGPQLILQQSLAVEQSAYGANGSMAERLHLSPSELDQSVGSIFESSSHLDDASTKLVSAIEEIFSHPAATPQVGNMSSALRMVAKGVVQTVERDLVDALHQLVDHVVRHFVDLLQGYKRAISDLDQQAREVASNEHVRLGPGVVVLSAAGTGVVAAAEAIRVSAVVNGEQADSVQVETVSVVEHAESLAGSAKPAAHATEVPATSRDAAEDLRLRAPGPKSTFAPANAGGEGGQALQTKKEVAAPHVAPAQSGTDATATLGTQHKGEQVRRIHDESPSPAPTSGSHLHVKRPDGPRPTAATAANSAHNVEEARAAEPVGTPDVDNSPAAHDVD